MRRLLVVLAILISAPLLVAHTLITTKITWSREVSRIVYKRCASCHHEGGSSFALLTYEQTRPWAEAIKQQVLSRRMPPWNAVKGFGDFKNDRGLTQEEIDIIASWVAGGAPEGIPAYLPALPNFRSEEVEKRNPGNELTFSGTLLLKHPLEVIGIEPRQVPPAGVLQVIAERPDGSVEPLIWIENFNSHYRGAYYFRNILPLPSGTKIEISPQAGSAALMVKDSPEGVTK